MLCICNLSLHVSQPNNKSRVSTLWLFYIAFDKSSSETSFISTKDVNHLSWDNLNQCFCLLLSAKVEKEESFGLSSLLHFDLSVLGLPVMRTSSCTAASCTSCLVYVSNFVFMSNVSILVALLNIVLLVYNWTIASELVHIWKLVQCFDQCYRIVCIHMWKG